MGFGKAFSDVRARGAAHRGAARGQSSRMFTVAGVIAAHQRLLEHSLRNRLLDGFQRDGQVQVTDGPFAETREQLAGFYLIDAKDLDQAIEVAAGIPPARVGSIEIRPIRELKP